MTQGSGGVNLRSSVVPVGAIFAVIVFLGGVYQFGTDYVEHEIAVKSEYFQTVAKEHARRIEKLEDKDVVFEEKIGTLLQDVAVIKSTLADIRDLLSSNR